MITVQCSPASGIVVDGTSRGDGTNKILGNRAKGGLGLKWSSHIGAWYVPHSRDQHNSRNRTRAEEIASALRDAGHEVSVEYSDDARSTAEAESELYARAEARADAYAGFASNAAGRAESRWQASHDAVAGIPMGQPILVGHHSQRRHERALEASHSNARKAVEEGGKARYWANRAEAASHLEQHRKNPGTTLRRIERYEASKRRFERFRDGYISGKGVYRIAHAPATGERREEILFEIAQLDEKIAYWKGIISEAEASGAVKVWTKADFKKGDFVLFHGAWWEVYRVNAKSLTIPWCHLGIGKKIVRRADAVTWQGEPSDSTDLLPYDKVQGHMTAAEAAEKFPA